MHALAVVRVALPPRDLAPARTWKTRWHVLMLEEMWMSTAARPSRTSASFFRSMTFSILVQAVTREEGQGAEEWPAQQLEQRC